MNKLLFLLIGIAFPFFLTAQIDISDARSQSEGTSVTIQGIATNGSEQGIIRYLQDATGGLPAYPGMGSVANFPESVKRGDLVRVTGTLKSFNGLLEIDPISDYTVVSSNNPLPAPKVVSPDGVNEANEGLLLRVEGISFADGGGVFSVGNYTFTANGEMGEIYVRSNHALIGSSIPLATVNLTGLASEFSGKHQLLPRDENDLEIADNFYLTSPLSQSNLTDEGFSISWTTNVEGNSNLRYGTDVADLSQEINAGGSTTNHSIALTGLEPAEFYYVQAFSNNGTSTISSAIGVYSTASNSSGVFKIYFNNEVDGNFSNGSYATDYTPAALEAAILDRIKAAQTTIDVSMYNVNREPIIAALTDAHNRGVQVRYTTDTETGNLALQDPTPPFRVIRGNADGLMHNKFFVFDANTVNDSWVIMGSTNMTSQNIANDRNNMIVLQDQAIAKAYTLEFQEMWGSDGPVPAIFNLKFGANKTNNTPHLFKIKDMLVESYFSPSDNTTIAISRAIATADKDFQFAILTFTNNELGAAVIDAHDRGIDIRGIIDNINDQGGEYANLESNGVNVIPDGTTVQTHHKYCIIDATDPNSDPQVVTGSHNWSGGADTRNDENTLIFHDKNIANVFLQEFEARWCESTGGNVCTTADENPREMEGLSVSVFPNPAVDRTQIKINLEERNDVVVNLWDNSGRLLQSNIWRAVQGEMVESILLSGLPVGNYFFTIGVEDNYVVRPLEIIR